MPGMSSGLQKALWAHKHSETLTHRGGTAESNSWTTISFMTTQGDLERWSSVPGEHTHTHTLHGVHRALADSGSPGSLLRPTESYLWQTEHTHCCPNSHTQPYTTHTHTHTHTHRQECRYTAQIQPPWDTDASACKLAHSLTHTYTHKHSRGYGWDLVALGLWLHLFDKSHTNEKRTGAEKNICVCVCVRLCCHFSWHVLQRHPLLFDHTGQWLWLRVCARMHVSCYRNPDFSPTVKTFLNFFHW